MKIAIFNDGYEAIDGVSRMVKLLKQEFDAKGHETYVFVPGKDAGEKDGVYKFTGFDVPTSPDYTLALPNVFRITSICRKLGIDVIHNHSVFTMCYSALYAKNKLGLKGVGTFHTLMPEYPHYMWADYPLIRPIWQNTAWGYISFFYNKFEVRTCPSKATQRILKEHSIDAKVVPNGIDVKKFNPKVKPDKFIKKYKLKGKKVVLAVGRIDKEKRFDLLLDAARLIDDPKYVFVIVGKGNYLRTYMESKPKNVIFTGFVPEELLPSAYASASCFVNCSLTETQGLTFLEAMATGVPIVSADCKVNRETVSKGGVFFKNTKELVENRDFLNLKIKPQYLAKTILKQIEDCEEDKITFLCLDHVMSMSTSFNAQPIRL